MPFHPLPWAPCLPAWRRRGAVVALAVFCLMPLRAQAQLVDVQMPVPPASKGVPSTATTSQFTAGVKFNVAPNTTITTGGYYSPRLDVRVPFLLLDHDLGGGWGLEAGYLYAAIDLQSYHLPMESEHILRLGMNYTKNFGQFTFDNRALVEDVIVHNPVPGAAHNIVRVRDRPRLTYHVAPESEFAPRLYTYVEPSMDTRTGQVTRMDYAAGIGFKLTPNVTTDLFYIRETAPSTHAGDVNFFALQVIYRIPSK